MKRVTCVLIGLSLAAFVCAPALAEADPEAIEILKKVDAAVKAVSSVSYEITLTPGGVAAERTPPAKGKAVLVGFNGNIPDKFYSHVSGKQGDTSIEMTGGGDGDSYFLIDHTTKKAYEDMDPAVMGSGANVLRGVTMIEFVHDRPYDDELGGDTVELQGTEKVGAEECYKIRVVYAGGQGETTWYFSKNDYLPRRRYRPFTTPQGDGSIDMVLTKLQVAPELDPGLFKLDLPEGYEKIDDFAP